MRPKTAWCRALILTTPVILLPLSGAAADAQRSLPRTGASLTPWFALAAVLFLLGVGLLAFHAHARRR